MPRMLPEDMEHFLQQPTIGVISTLRADGRPYTVPIWWLWKDGVAWVTGTYSRVWCQQLLKDPRASLCIESGPPLTGHVGLDGVAEPFELPGFDIWETTLEIVQKYIGRGDPANDDNVATFFANMVTEPRLLFRLTPDVTRAIDMRVYRGKRADREYQAAVTGEGAGQE